DDRHVVGDADHAAVGLDAGRTGDDVVVGARVYAPQAGEQVGDLDRAERRGLAQVCHRVDEPGRLAEGADGATDAAALRRRSGSSGEHRGEDVEGDRAARAGRVLAPLVPGDQRLARLLDRVAGVAQIGRQLVLG